MKKILSLILCFVLCLAVYPASAEEEAIVLSNDGGSLRFLSALGITASSTDGNMPVTRGELAKMFYRILINKYVPDFSDYVIDFSDVKEEDTEPIRACAALGIMNGIGGGLFGTDNNVTYAQALKAVVSFLGYSVKAETMGGWPTGYHAVAISLGMLHNPPSDLNSVLTYNGAADLFRYAAEAPIMESYGNEKYTVEDDITYISHYFNIVRGSGVITANSVTNFDGEPLSYGRIALNGEVMNLCEDSVPVADLIGMSAELFCTKEGSKYKVVYYESNDNTITTFDKDAIISAGYDQYVYETSEGKEKKVNLDKRVIVVYNNTVVESYDLNTLNPYTTGKYDGIIKCIDNTGDNKADVIFVEAYETMVVASVKNDLISSKIRSGTSIDISDYEENSINILNASGQPILPSEIAAGDILTYYRDFGGRVTRIYVTVESSSGKIDYLTKENNIITAVSIGGIEYKCSRGVSLNPDNDKLAPGMYVSVYFDRYGYVSDMEAAVFDGELGLLVDYKPNEGMIDTHMVKIFGTDSKFKTFNLAKKIKLNEERIIKPEQFLSICGTAEGSTKIKRQVVKYSTNANGEISAICLANPAVDANGEYVSDYFIYKNYDGTQAHRYTDVFNCFDLQLFPGGQCKVFVAPEEGRRDLETAYRIGYSFSDGESPKIIAYGDDPNSASPLAMLYVTSFDTSANLTTNYNIFAVERVAQRLDENGDEVFELVGWMSKSSNTGKLQSIEIANIEALKAELGGSLPESGDIIKFSLNAEDKIEKALYVFDKSEEKLCGEFAGNPNKAYNIVGNRFVYGDIIYNDGNYLTIEIVSDGGAVTKENYPVSRFTGNGAAFVKDNPKSDGRFKMTEHKDIYDRYTYGRECSKALVFTSGKWWICAIVFND